MGLAWGGKPFIEKWKNLNLNRNLLKRTLTTIATLLVINATHHIEAKPVIGINLDAKSSAPDDQTGVHLSLNYIDAITSAGGIPILIPPVLGNEEALDKYIAICDGFLFTGGADINPALYNAKQHPAHKQLSFRRQEFDFNLMKKVLKSRKPIMGICLGCQQLNVATGGNLIQDIPTETTSTITHRQGLEKNETVHEVIITSGSRIADIISTTSINVNSFHHQSVRETATSVSVVAKSPDGIVEAIELNDYPFGIGVQWHPEGLTSISQHEALFKELVRKSEEFKDKSKR